MLLYQKSYLKQPLSAHWSSTSDITATIYRYCYKLSGRHTQIKNNN